MDNYIAHILVVDDDDGIRSLVKKYLMRYLKSKKKEFTMLYLIQALKKF